MSESLILLGDVKSITFDELQIEHSIRGESHFRMLVIESGNGDTFRAKLCGDEWSLKAIEDKEFDSFCADRDVEWDQAAEVVFNGD